MQHSGHFAKGLEKTLVRIDEISLDDKNPRLGNIEAIAKSYERFGQRKPIVTATRNGKTTVIAGNHQLMAARKLGWSHIAAVHVDEAEAESAAFAVADNLTHDLGSYDFIKLSALVDSLSSEGVSYESIGFDELSVADIAAIVEPETDNESEELISKRYSEFTMRTLVVHMTIPEFEFIQSKMSSFGSNHGISTNAESMVRMIEIATGKEAPPWN